MIFAIPELIIAIAECDCRHRRSDIQPLNQYLTTELHRNPLSASRLARYALDDRRKIARELEQDAAKAVARVLAKKALAKEALAKEALAKEALAKEVPPSECQS
jgi:glucose-6-phosphate-specific signal transduction histidine kinase